MSFEVLPLKRLLVRNDGGTWGSDPTGTDDTIVLRSTEQTVNGDWNIEKPATRAIALIDRARFRLVEGDLLMTKSSGSPRHIGKTTRVTRDVANLGAVYSNFMQRLRVRSDCDSRYFWYSLQADIVRDQITLISTTSTGLANLNGADIGKLLMPAPDGELQRKIADFLDAQVARVDLLLEKQQALIDSLDERIDIEWAAIYAGLEAAGPNLPLRRVITSVVDGPFGSSLTSAHYSSDGAGVVRLGNIGVNEFKLHDRAYIPTHYAEELKAHAVIPGDVVVAGLGDERMPLGRAAVVPREFGDGIVKADCYRVRPSPVLSGSYLAWVLSAPQSRVRFQALSRGSTRQRLNTRVVREVVVPIPLQEQQDRSLAAFAETRLSIDALSAKAREMIGVLKERRQALISAAVTGQIDVRGLA